MLLQGVETNSCKFVRIWAPFGSLEHYVWNYKTLCKLCGRVRTSRSLSNILTVKNTERTPSSAKYGKIFITGKVFVWYFTYNVYISTRALVWFHIVNFIHPSFLAVYDTGKSILSKWSYDIKIIYL